ncbi:MAG: hypothetical protein ISS79_11770 [Phycisphaerae bacterium]|nr:hypothetical protein [Phycisphaerae bacterium]
MAEKVTHNQKLFCERPVDPQMLEDVKAKWKELVQTQSAGKAVRFAQEPDRHFAALKAFYGSSPMALSDLLSNDSPRLKSAFELALGACADLRAKIMATLVSASREVVLTDVFEGVVTSITDKEVIVEFKVDDDLDVRQFSWDDIGDIYKWLLEEGQAVRARCELELVPPREPMSSEEIEKWKRQYRDVRGYLKKAKKGVNLLDEENE